MGVVDTKLRVDIESARDAFYLLEEDEHMRTLDRVLDNFCLNSEYILVKSPEVKQFVNMNWFIDEAIPNIQGIEKGVATSFFIPKKYIV